MIGTILMSLGYVVVGAILGAYLTKRWTPNPTPELTALRGELADFKERIDTLERERVDVGHLPIFISLENGENGNYSLTVRNESDEELAVQSVSMLWEGVDLSRSGWPPKPDEWRVKPHSRSRLSWVPNPDPVAELGMSRSRPSHGVPVKIEFVLYCKIRGKAKVLRKTVLVGVDFGNYRMEQITPKA